MSIKNKATDRDRHGRIARKYTAPEGHPWNTPGWWITLYMSRPRRRANKAACRALMSGNTHPDEAIYPLGNHKPQNPYW